MYISKQELASAITHMESQIRLIEQEISSIGDERIVCRRKNGRFYYTEKSASREHGITRNMPRVSQLLRKELLQERLKLLQQNLTAIRVCHSAYRDFSVSSLSYAVAEKRGSLPVENILQSKKDLRFKNYIVDPDAAISNVEQWLSHPYPKNPYFPEHLKYYTTGGLAVRSKSEREIGNMLDFLNVPFHYDVAINCGHNTYYVDFLILRPDGTLLLWEHLGLIDDDSYRLKNQQKIWAYTCQGFRQWDNLICTYENDTADSRTIRKIIEKFILYR